MTPKMTLDDRMTPFLGTDDTVQNGTVDWQSVSPKVHSDSTNVYLTYQFRVLHQWISMEHHSLQHVILMNSMFDVPFQENLTFHHQPIQFLLQYWMTMLTVLLFLMLQHCFHFQPIQIQTTIQLDLLLLLVKLFIQDFQQQWDQCQLEFNGMSMIVS